MRTFKLTLAYDGGAYSGWQWQPGRVTLQGALEQALARTIGVSTRVVASGRTDAGVHALGQVVSFACPCELPVEVFERALASRLPRDMAIRCLEEAPPGFHAIRDAVRKRYRYVLRDGVRPNLFERKYAWQIPPRLDVEAMDRAAAALLGEHDFSSFETHGAERRGSIRTVHELTVRRQSEVDPDRIVLEIAANGFLYNMVRAIVGTLVSIGRGTRGETWAAEALAACDRRAAGPTAPPHGLFLVEVDYRAADRADGGALRSAASPNGASLGSAVS